MLEALDELDSNNENPLTIYCHSLAATTFFIFIPSLYQTPPPGPLVYSSTWTSNSCTPQKTVGAEKNINVLILHQESRCRWKCQRSSAWVYIFVSLFY